MRFTPPSEGSLPRSRAVCVPRRLTTSEQATQRPGPFPPLPDARVFSSPAAAPDQRGGHPSFPSGALGFGRLRRPGDTSKLVGREDELALVDALLANPGEALLLHGDPGVGKSAIAAAAVSRASTDGATVLTTTGMPSETEVPYTSLQPLLWPVLDDADGLPAPQRAALHAALGLSAEPPKDPFRTGMAVLNLLGDAAERAPVVVVAEDAHWLDEGTTEVLAFVARRIEADAITILVTSRETIPRALRGLPSRTLAPLTSEAAEALLHALDAGLAPATRARILEQAQGNPLGLVELLTSSA